MPHIAFFESRYAAHNPQEWALRGSYKYPSLLGDLPRSVQTTILMRDLPPEDDPHRIALTRGKVRFREFDSNDDPRFWLAEELSGEMKRYMTRIGAEIVSNLSGRVMGHNYAIAMSADALGLDYVYRVAGNDIETRGGVFEAEGHSFWGTAAQAVLAMQERMVVDIASRVIVMSRKEARRLERIGARPDRLHVCMRGVDRSHFTPGPEPTGSCSRFLYVGRRSFEKGYDKIEAVAEDFADSHPDIDFTFAGWFEPRREGNRAYRSFVGFADLPALYREQHALVVCSRSEGFPQVIMEAMACGLPCILSASLFGDDFTDGEDCLLVGQDWRDVGEAVARLHGDRALYLKLREGALARAERDFDETLNRAHYHRALMGQP